MRKNNILIIAILFMAVGFAAVTTNLIINGTVVIGNKASDYDIKFTNAILDGVEDNSVIIEDGQKISYETKELKSKGESSELIYEITNNSSQYDGEVSIECVPKGTTTHTNLYAIDTTNTPGIVMAKRSANGSIVITLIEDSTEEIREEFVCTLTIDAVERTIIAEKEDYKEVLLNGTDPVISGDLIPVTLSDDGTVTYANTKEEWYNYENKEWANAVILKENPSKDYKTNDVILENDIESYFVWIPKYKYQLWNIESTTNVAKKAHSIEIVFGTENTEDIEGESCATPMTSEGIGQCNNGEYMTHPAFISFGVNGLWVGKFETGYKGATTTESAQVNPDTSTIEKAKLAAEKIQIKPNVYSWRNLTINNMFIASYNYNRDLDSHMMKNTEWGAVAYLSHSKYGIGYEVNINNNSSYKTGYSADPSTNQQTYPGTFGDGETYNQPYNTSIGYLATTTGNISGVYDMSGGAHEFTSSHISGKIGSSEFTTIDNYNSKYFDVYNEYSAINTYNYRILGDATGEMGPFNNYLDGDNNARWHNSWYGDYSDFAESIYPWFLRGGFQSHGVLAGQFSFDKYTGGPLRYIGFRIVLAV